MVIYIHHAFKSHFTFDLTKIHQVVFEKKIRKSPPMQSAAASQNGKVPLCLANQIAASQVTWEFSSESSTVIGAETWQWRGHSS